MAVRGPPTTAQEWPLLAATGGKPMQQTKTQHSQNKYINNIIFFKKTPQIPTEVIVPATDAETLAVAPWEGAWPLSPHSWL